MTYRAPTGISNAPALVPLEAPPPHDPDAERAIVAAVIYEPALLPDISAELQAEHIYGRPLQLIYAAALALHTEGQPVDPVTVAGRLRSEGRLAEVGGGGSGAAYIAALVDSVPATLAPGPLHAYVQTIRGHARARHMLSECRTVAALLGVGGITEEAARARLAAVSQGGDDSRKSRIEALPFRRFADRLEPPPPPLWTIPTLEAIPGRPTLIVAPPGGAKTWFVQAVVHAFVNGLGLFENPTMRGFRPGRALHIDLDNGLDGIERRYWQLAIGAGVSINPDLLGIDEIPCPLNDDGAEGLWTDFLAYHAPQLVVVDSLRASTDEDENDSRVGNSIKALRIASTRARCAVLLIHHSGKSGESRGSTAIKGQCGAVWHIDPTDDAGLRKVTHDTASRDGGEKKEPFYFRFETTPAVHGLTGVRLVYVSREAATQASQADGETAKLLSSEELEALAPMMVQAQNVLRHMRFACSCRALADQMHGDSRNRYRAIKGCRQVGAIVGSGTATDPLRLP